MTNFSEIEDRSSALWQDLNHGNLPWIRIGTAMCGQAAGALEVLNAIRAGIASRGLEANIDEVGCIGICHAEPLLDIQLPGESRVFFQNLSPMNAPTLVNNYIEHGQIDTELGLGYLGESPVDGLPDLNSMPGINLQTRIALRNAGHIAPNSVYQYVANGGYHALNKALFEMQPSDVIDEVKNSGLRGRGGAGFSTGIKWSFMVNSPGPPKYILCNCEEGDPGAYNDKGILESDPHTLLEGVMLAGYATGATKGFVFIRHGHDGPISRTETAINQAYAEGLLGKKILGSEFDFDIEISLTGESYVAGEETALMESIEGNRSMPRFKPPFPAAFGVWGKPSTVNNVKSLSYAPQIISKGADWFSSIGPENCTGTIIICLTGDVNHPGMYEIPMGLKLGQVIEELGGGTPSGKPVKMIQLGGPLGHILNKQSLEYGLDFDDMKQNGAMLGSGGVIVGDEERCAVDMTRVLVAFCQYESCGKCFPCRLGMTHLLELITSIADNTATSDQIRLMESIGGTMESASLCFHGQLGFNPIRSAIVNFQDDFDSHIYDKQCPTGACDANLLAPRNMRPHADSYREGTIPLRSV